MNLLIFNIGWMSWNLFLACLGVFFGWWTLHSQRKLLKLPLFLLWLLFVPNSLYVITDLIHLPEQLYQGGEFAQPFIAMQFLLFIAAGVATYVLSMYYFDKFMTKLLKNYSYFHVPVIVLFNFIIAFGVIMGRLMRTNSWYVFTNPNVVYQDVVSTVTSPAYMYYVVVFWLLANVIYFSVRNPFKPAGLYTFIFPKLTGVFERK